MDNSSPAFGTDGKPLEAQALPGVFLFAGGL